MAQGHPSDRAGTAPTRRATTPRPTKGGVGGVAANPHTPSALLDQDGNPVAGAVTAKVPRPLAQRHEYLRALTAMDTHSVDDFEKPTRPASATTAIPTGAHDMKNEAPRGGMFSPATPSRPRAPKTPKSARARWRPRTATTRKLRASSDANTLNKATPVRPMPSAPRGLGSHDSAAAHTAGPATDLSGSRLRQGHTGDVQCVCFCPPSMIASGGSDGLVFIWSLDTGTALNEYRWRDSDAAQLVDGLHTTRPGDESLHHDGRAGKYDAPFSSTDMGACDSLCFCRHLVSVAAGYSNGWVRDKCGGCVTARVCIASF